MSVPNEPPVPVGVRSPGGHGLGWSPDPPDQRDLLIRPTSRRSFPRRVDLREDPASSAMPPYDQSYLGSCTANGITALMQYQALKAGGAGHLLSRLFLYYAEREMEGTLGWDSGAFIRDGIKAAAVQGVAHETSWPYDPGRFTERPPHEAYVEAMDHQVTLYQRVPKRQADIKEILASGLPFTFGITLYPSFESGEALRSGVVPIPDPSERPIGGHCMDGWGYEKLPVSGALYLITRNSWGTGIGEGGYMFLPMDYVLSVNASDFWCVRTVEWDAFEAARRRAG